MKKQARVELAKDDMKFSSGHFTIFSATKREALHGHNFSVAVVFTAEYEENGMPFDYRIYKRKLYAICKELDGYFLLPRDSVYLRLEEEGDYLYAHFDEEKIPFLKKDVIVLPMSNVTVEELSQWVIAKLLEDQDEIARCNIQEITVKVSTIPGQAASTVWTV